jgi:hypothetical protein
MYNSKIKNIYYQAVNLCTSLYFWMFTMWNSYKKITVYREPEF